MENGNGHQPDFMTWALTPEYREIDVGAFSPARAGEKLRVQVNAPGVVEAMFGGRKVVKTTSTDEKGKVITHEEFEPEPGAKGYERMRRAIACLVEKAPGQKFTPEELNRIDDRVIVWMYNAAEDVYFAYREEVERNLASG